MAVSDELRARVRAAGFQISATDSVRRPAAALLLGRSAKTLANLASKGIGPAMDADGRYTIDSILRYLLTRRDRRRRENRT